ncbi:hypothetical protein [Pseudomonas phage Waldo5]|uniref:Uncharacterized protein n=1 Tax=Pseudomonas phage Waldo5 TaxID=2762290 RepID=A0A7G8LJL0_9CAUD|nr:hypothetical protein [Pseudomonas phage Waldo5]
MSKHTVDITARIVQWAEQHDWFVSAHKLNTDTRIHYYKVVVRDESSSMGIRYFESYQELRNWAGY